MRPYPLSAAWIVLLDHFGRISCDHAIRGETLGYDCVRRHYAIASDRDRTITAQDGGAIAEPAIPVDEDLSRILRPRSVCRALKFRDFTRSAHMIRDHDRGAD